MEIDIIGLISACSYALDCIEAELVNIKNKHGKRVAYISVRMGQYFDLPEPIQWISRSCVSGSTLYFTASILSGQDTYIDKDGNEVSYDTYSEGLFRFEPDSGECVQLVNYVDKPDVDKRKNMADDGDVRTQSVK